MNKVLIIDEVHAYDMYMSQIIKRLMQWCAALEIPVILLSATLPDKKKRALIKAYAGGDAEHGNNAYPLVTCAYPDGTVVHTAAAACRHTSLHIEQLPLMGQYGKLAQTAVRCISQGGCLCVIVNTVDAAQKLYLEIKKIAADGVWLMLWHARFPSGRRMEIERACESAFSKDGKRPISAILVATQVAEQSCDFSFDYMISELAPIDLLLQRSGRLHRHPVGLCGKIEPRLTVLTPEKGDYGASGYVYKPYLLEQTKRVLDRHPLIGLPEDMRMLIGSVYDNLPETDTEGWLEYQFSADMERAQGESAAIKAPAKDRFGMASVFGSLADDDEAGVLAASTRLGEPSENVIFLEEDEEITDTGELLKRSCSLRRSLLTLQGCGYSQTEISEGRLKGYKIIRTKNGIFEGVTEKQKLRYKLDMELGVIVERGEKHGI